MLRVGKYDLPEKNKRPKRACSFCRRKKVKCDQKVPCSTCIRYGNDDCDLWIPPPEANNTPKLKLIPKLKTRAGGDTSSTSLSGILSERYSKKSFKEETIHSLGERCILFNSDEETVNLHEGKQILGTGPVDRQTFGPLSWVTLHLNDNYYMFLIHFCKSLKDFDTLLNDMNTYAKECEKFKSNMYLSKNNHSCRKSLEGDSEVHTMFAKDECKNTNAYNGSLSLKEKLDKVELIDRLKNILPSRTEINSLMNIFFGSIHGLIPIVDESDFREKIRQIFENKHDTIDIQKKNDFVTLGILFLILRLSAISACLLSNVTSQEEITSEQIQNERYYIERTAEYFSAAKICLENTNLYQCNNIPALQLLIFVYVLHIYSPEENGGLDGRPTKKIFSNILQLALSIGLNNDPSKLPPRFRHPKLDNISRKIWCFIVYLDICDSIATGDPLSTAALPSDTQWPTFSELELNNDALNLEREIIENLQKRYVILGHLSGVLSSLLNTNKDLKLKDLSTKIDSIVSINQEIEVSIKEFATSSKVITFSNAMNILHYLNMNSLLFSLYFKLFLHHEKTSNHVLCDHYIIKYMDCSLRSPYRLYLYIRKEAAIFNNSCFKLVIIPNILHMMQKSFICILLLLIRLKFLREKWKNREAKSGMANNLSTILKCDEVVSLLLRRFTVLTDITHTLFSSYYVAWRMYRVSTFVISMVLSDEFNARIAEKFLNFDILVNENTLDKIISLLCDIENEENIDESLNTTDESLIAREPSTDVFLQSDLERLNDIWSEPARNGSYSENEDRGDFNVFDFLFNSGLDFDLNFESAYQF